MVYCDGSATKDLDYGPLGIVAHPARLRRMHRYLFRINQLGCHGRAVRMGLERAFPPILYNRWIDCAVSTNGSDHLQLAVGASVARVGCSSGGVGAAAVPGTPALRGALSSAR